MERINDDPTMGVAPKRKRNNVKKVFGIDLNAIEHRRCEHTNGNGSDMQNFYQENHGRGFYISNNECFQQGLVLAAYTGASKELAKYLIQHNLNVNYDRCHDIIVQNEHYLELCPHYNLFLASAFQAIYSHVTKYFGLGDLFFDHRKWITNMVESSGAVENVTSDGYDQMLYEFMNDAGADKSFAYYDYVCTINELCHSFEDQFLRGIYKDIRVIAMLYIFNYYGLVEMRDSTFHLAESLKKAACACKQHNAIYFVLEALVGRGGNPWFQRYSDAIRIHGEYDLYEPIDSRLKTIYDDIKNEKNPTTAYHPTVFQRVSDHLAITIPIDAMVRVNAPNVVTMYDSFSGRINNKSNYVLISNRPPDFSYCLPEHTHEYFSGHYVILSQGGSFLIYNINSKRKTRLMVVEISMQHQNYITWVETIVPRWNADAWRKRNRLLVFNHDLQGVFDNDLDCIMSFLSGEGFPERLLRGFGNLMSSFGKSG